MSVPTQANPKFEWKPLEQPRYFRLLGLRHAYGSDKKLIPSWSLAHFDLQHDHPPYRALSYTWAGQSATEELSCDNQVMLVPQTVFEFLNAVFIPTSIVQAGTNPDLCVWLWVDGICIDQKNEAEKSTQVGMMGNIFSSAQRVYMWLGPATNEDEQALQFLTTLEEFLEPFYQGGQTDQIGFTLQHLYSDGLPVDDLIALSKLMGKTYFSRMWIVQEVAMAQELHLQIGSHVLAWDKFAETCERIARDPTIFGGFSFPLDMLKVQQMRQMYQERSKLSLLHLMGRFRKHQCFDPRDKLFAVLGLSDEKNKQANYTWSAKDIYHSFAISRLHRGQLNEILSHTSTKSTLQMPSWVPDWSVSDRNEHLLLNQLFNAGGDEDVSVQVSVDGQLLLLSGILIDKINETIPTPNLANARVEEWFTEANIGNIATILEAHSEKRHSWLSICDSMITPPVVERYAISREELLWRVLICDRDINGHQASEEHGEFFRHYRQQLREGIDTSLDGESWSNAAMAAMMCGPLVAAMQFRAFARTEKSRLAVVPDTTMPGDCVCVLKGLRAPFIVRPDNENTYRMVGEAYVHGIMQGEVMNSHAHLMQQILIR